MVNYNFGGLSRESQLILAYGYGYRNNYIYGSGVDDAFKIIDYEVLELGNTDILYTCRKLYGLKLDIRKKKESIYIIKMFLRSVLGESKIYGMWFGTEENINKYYEGKGNCSCYFLPRNYGEALVISDLGPEGSLVVSVNPFQEIFK